MIKQILKNGHISLNYRHYQFSCIISKKFLQFNPILHGQFLRSISHGVGGVYFLPLCNFLSTAC